MGHRSRGRGRTRQLPHPRQSHDRGSAVCRGRASARRRIPEEGTYRSHRWEATLVTDVSRDSAERLTGDAQRLEMRLRPNRPPVMRLSRKVLIALGLVAAVAIASALFFALQPRRQFAGSELYNTDNRTTPDALSNLPRDYAGLPKNIPQLGPPLPGDLGRPILNAGAGNASAPSTPDPE